MDTVNLQNTLNDIFHKSKSILFTNNERQKNDYAVFPLRKSGLKMNSIIKAHFPLSNKSDDKKIVKLPLNDYSLNLSNLRSKSNMRLANRNGNYLISQSYKGWKESNEIGRNCKSSIGKLIPSGRNSLKNCNKTQKLPQDNKENSYIHDKSIQKIEDRYIKCESTTLQKLRPKIDLVKLNDNTKVRILHKDHWKLKHDKLMIDHTNLLLEYKNLMENYQLSEQIRKQQCQQIKVLEDKLDKRTCDEDLPFISVNVKRKSINNNKNY